MPDGDYKIPNDANVSPEDIHDEANLSGADLTGADLRNANLINADLTGAYLGGADLSGAELIGADLTGAFLMHADFTSATLERSTLTNADLGGVNLAHANLSSANLRNAVLVSADLTNATVAHSNFTDATLSYADFTNARASDADFTGAKSTDVDFTDTNLQGSDLKHTDLEGAIFVRTNLFNSNLTNSKPHGAVFTNVQINDNTKFQSKSERENNANWWQKGPLFPFQRCSYDPEYSKQDGSVDIEQLGKAADTYQKYEKIARENAQPSLQRAMFVLRQDMQCKRHWCKGEYFKWTLSRISRVIFKYGESLTRISIWAVLTIVTYAVLYVQFGLIEEVGGESVNSVTDALYFSTLTFTTLGLGDFRPEPTSEVARLLVTSQAAFGAILIAVFVFVLGRRAAR